MLQTDERAAIIRLLLYAVGIVGVALGAYLAVQWRKDTQLQRQTELLKVEESLIKLLSTLQDTETGQRGYLLTQNDDYLAPYREGVRRTPERIDALATLLLDHSDDRDRDRLVQVRSLSERKLAELAETIRLAQAGELDHAYDLVASNLGQNLMDSLRLQITALSSSHRAQYESTTGKISRLDRALLLLVICAATAMGYLIYTVSLRVNPLLDQLIAAQNDLRAKNKELEHFAYIASHDLNEPLRTMAGFIEILKEEYPPTASDETATYFEFITAASERMQIMIAELLNYSRLGHAKDFGPVPLNELLAEIVADVQLRIKGSNATLAIAPLPTVNARRTEVRLLFQNLILNALKFSPPGVAPQIRIDCRPVTGAWEFSVVDNGIGIAKKKQQLIFNIFTKLHRAEEYEGYGIGLAFCKKIVEGHGGRIWVSSEPERGSSFYFTIAKAPKDVA